METVSRVFALSCFLTAVLLIAFAPVGPAAAQTSNDTIIVLQEGLVFDAGRFVAGPYTLRKTESGNTLDVVVANIRLDRIVARDPAVQDNLEGEPLPESYAAPEGVDTLRGSGYPLYLHRLLKRHAARDGIARALDVVEAHASSSPLVARVERKEDGLLLFDGNGEPYFVEAGPFLEPPRLSREEASAVAEQALQAYRELLAQGGAILHFDDADVFLPRARVEDLLIPSLGILADTAASRASRRDRLLEHWRNDGIVDALLDGYRPAPELRAALERYANGGGR